MPPGFFSPPWDAPLDVKACIDAIPHGVTVKGLFMSPMVVEARKRNIVLKGARDRYLPFNDYPLAEHARLLVETAHAFYPNLSMRQGLRKLGRASHAALVETVVGKVVWAGVEDVGDAIESAAKGYAITSRAMRVSVVEIGPGRARVRLEGVHHFLDSHHVGVFEGTLHSCNVKATIDIRLDTPSDGEFLLTWGEVTLPTRSERSEREP